MGFSDPTSKPWWQSKTIWVNTITAVIALISALAGQDFIKENPQLVSLFVMLIAVLNAVLRWVTTLPLTTTAKILPAIMLMLVAGFGQQAMAIDVLLNTTGASAGKYILELNADGTVKSISPLGQVVNLVGPQPPGPPTPPPAPTERSKAITAAALQVPTSGTNADKDRANTALGLAKVYRTIATTVRSSPAQTDAAAIAKAVKSGTDSLLSFRNLDPSDKGPWQPVRSLLALQWSAIIGPNNQPPDVTQYAGLLEDAASGLEAAAGPSADLKQIDPQLLAFIEQVIIPLILALLKTLH